MAGKHAGGGGAVPPHGQDQRGHADGPGQREALLPGGAADRPGLPALHPRPQGHPGAGEGLGRATSRRCSRRPQQTEDPRGQGARAAGGGAATTRRRKEDRDDGHALLRGGAQARRPTASRRRARWPTSTSRARTGRRPSGCWTSSRGRWRRRAIAEKDGALARGAVPAALPAGLRGGEAGQAATRRSTRTRRPTSWTPRTCRRWRASATCSCRRSATRRRSRSTRPSSSTTATSLTDLEVVEVYWQLGDVHAAAEAAGSRAEPLREGAGDRPGARAVAAGAGDADGQGGPVREGRRATGSSCVNVLDGEAEVRRSAWSWASSRGRSSRTRTWRSTRTCGALKVQPDALEVMDALYVLLPRDAPGARRRRTCCEQMLALPALTAEPQQGQAGVVRARRDRAATS